MLGGYPGTPESWKICRAEATEAMEKAAKQLEFPRQGDRRGPFRTIAVGVSYGGGQTVSNRGMLSARAHMLPASVLVPFPTRSVTKRSLTAS